MPNRSHFALRHGVPTLVGCLVLAVTLTWTSRVLAQRAPAPDADPRIEKLVASVSEQRLRELDTKLGNFENRSGTLHKAGPQCSGKTPQVCSSFVEERDLYLDDFASDPAKFEQALADWDKPKEVEND